MFRIVSSDVLPCSRMARPVSLRNTSSRLGRRALTAVIGTVSSEKSRGMNDAESGTSTRSVPSTWTGSRCITLRICSACDRRVRRGDGHHVTTDPGLQLRRRPERDDLALVDDGDAIAELGLVHVVRGHEDGDVLARAHRVQVVPDLVARLWIETERRLVEEQHLRVVQDAARDLQPPPHPAGVGEHRGVGAVGQLDDRQGVVDALLARRRGQTVEVGVEVEVLAAGELTVERRVLEDQADARTDRARDP